MRKSIGKAVIELTRGDITRVSADVIVNAANSSLAGGGGVDGAIHRAAGPELMRELDKVRPEEGCPAGSAVITPSGKLPAKWVVHAVGPRWRGGGHGEAGLLASAHRRSLQLAAEKGAKRVAFPAISTGVYGYPVGLAAAVAIGAVASFLGAEATSISEVIFVLFDAESLAAFQSALSAL